MPFFCSPFACLRRKRNAKHNGRALSHVVSSPQQQQKKRSRKKHRHHPRFIDCLSTPAQWSRAVVADIQDVGLISALKRHVSRLAHEALYRPDKLRQLLLDWIDVQKATDFQSNNDDDDDVNNNNNSSRNRVTMSSSSTQSGPPLQQGVQQQQQQQQVEGNVSSPHLHHHQGSAAADNDQQTCTSTTHISMIRTETNQNSSGVNVIKLSNCQLSEQQQQHDNNNNNNTSRTVAPAEQPTRTEHYHHYDNDNRNQNQHQIPSNNSSDANNNENFVDALETPRDNNINAPLASRDDDNNGEPHDDEPRPSSTYHTEQSSHQLSWKKNPRRRKKPKPGLPIPDVVERDGTPVTVYHRDPTTTQSGPLYTFVPCSCIGVTNVIKYALREGFSITHDETPHRYDSPNTATAATIGEEETTPGNDDDNNKHDRYIRIRLSKQRGEFKQIELIRVIPTTTITSPDNNNSSSLLSPNSSSLFSTAHVRIGATVSATQVRAWCARSTYSGEQEQHHGWNIKFDDDDSDTLDIRSIVSMELINCGGEFQSVRDRALVTAAAECFGCLGIVTARVVEARRVRHAVVMPEKPLLLFDAVPPYRKTDVSPNVIGRFQENKNKNAQLTVTAVDYNSNTDGVHGEMQREEERELEFMRFYVRCKRDFAQFTWIPFQKQCWVHCWDAITATDQIVSSNHEINEHDNIDEQDISFNRSLGRADNDHGNNNDDVDDCDNGLKKRKDDNKNNKSRHRSSYNGPNEFQLTANYLLQDDDSDTYDDDDDDDTCVYRSSTTLLHDELREGGRRHRALVRFMNDCERQGVLAARETMEICGHSALSNLPSGDVVRSNDQDATYLWRVAQGDCSWHHYVECDDEEEEETQGERQPRDGYGDDDGEETNLIDDDVAPPSSGNGLDTGDIEYNTHDGYNRNNDKSRNDIDDNTDWETNNSDDNDSSNSNSSSRSSSRSGYYKTCVLDIEIAGNMDGTPDYSVCQRAWWIAINAVYDALPGLPLRTSVQMRVTKPVIATTFATPPVNSVTIPSSSSAVSIGATSSHHSHHNRLGGVALPEALTHQHYNNNNNENTMQTTTTNTTTTMMTTTFVTPIDYMTTTIDHHPTTTATTSVGENNASEENKQQNTCSNTSTKALRPQLFNPFGICTLILTTTTTVSDTIWDAYLQHVVNACVCLTHPITGRPLHVRPRPMTKWPRQVHGASVEAFLKEECKRERVMFKKALANVCVDAGYNLSESLGLFAGRDVVEFLREGSAARSSQQ